MIICKSISKQSTVFWGLLAVALLLLGYTVLSYCQHVRNPADTTIPTWSQLAHGVATVCTPDRKGERWIVVDTKATGFRLFFGLTLGVGGAVVLGIALGSFARLGAFFNPLLSLFTKHPPTAMLAVFFVMVGTDTPMYVVMIAFGVLPCLAQAIYLSVREIPEEMINKGYTLGASSGEQILHVIVPAILPKVLDSIRLQIGPAIVFLIAAEMVVGNEGFGYRIRLQSKLLNMSVVYPYIEMLAGFGYLLDYLLRLTQARFCGWYIRKDS